MIQSQLLRIQLLTSGYSTADRLRAPTLRTHRILKRALTLLVKNSAAFPVRAVRDLIFAFLAPGLPPILLPFCLSAPHLLLSSTKSLERLQGPLVVRRGIHYTQRIGYGIEKEIHLNRGKELIESLVQDRGGQLNTIEVGEQAFRLRKRVSPTLKERVEARKRKQMVRSKGRT